MNYTASEIAEMTDAKLIGDENVLIRNIVFDSRTIYSVTDTAFIALNSERNSGEKYISEAIEKGIKIIISTRQNVDNKEITWLLTDDSEAFLQKLAKEHLCRLHSLKKIGVTGSNGKTVVKEWLYQALNSEFSVVKSPKSFNSQIGLPLSVLQAEASHQIGIFEAGISQPDEMKRLENILHPDIGVFTNIGTAHSANFESERQQIEEKIKLFEKSETIVFNGDNELVVKEINETYSGKNLITFGLSEKNQIYPLSWQDTAKPVQICLNGKIIEFPAEARDEATISNVLCVAAVLDLLGMKPHEIITKINSLKSVEMRLESLAGNHNNLIINDSYNLDVDSLKIAFQFIKEYRKKDKVLIITDFVGLKNPGQNYPKILELIDAQNFTKVFFIGHEISAYSDHINAESFTFNSIDEIINKQELGEIQDSVILIKGARKFQTERLINILQLQKHDTVLEVNLNALLENINVHKSLLHPKTKLMAMVKAFAYGTGGFEIAEFLQHHHIDYLGVAYVDEGVDLRKNGITVPIMVMNPEQHSYDTIIDYNLEPEIYSFRVLNLFLEALKSKGIQEKYPIHIKLETGMHRLGFKEHELEDLIKRLNSESVIVKSIFSHLSTSDMEEEHDYTRFQLDVFEKNSSKLIDGLSYKPIRHILNSAGIAFFPDYQYEMVRIGIGMYGISADKKIEKLLQSVVTFKTVVSQISDLKTDESVSYGRHFRASAPTRIATIPVGYADGIPRLISNGKGKVGINNKLFPIVGNICMDMMMVDIGDEQVSEGDEVIIFNAFPSLKQFSEFCETIPYEVLTSISRRVKRIYIKK